MLRFVEVNEHCAERGTRFYGARDTFVAETVDVRVFSVGCLSHADTCMVRGLSSGFYDENVVQQLHPYANTNDGLSLELPDGDEVDEAVLLWGDRNFGHWIFTYLSRLPILFLRPELLSKPLMVLSDTPESFTDWLPLMGFRNFFRARDGSRVKKLWVPSVVHYRDEKLNVHLSANSVRILRHLLVKKDGGNERIYISRDRTQWRKVANEDELVRILEKHRIRRVFIEDLTAAQQLALVGRCELIVSVIGAASPITMFAPTSCRILDIGLPGFSGVFGSRAWAAILGQPYDRIDGQPLGSGANSNMVVNIGEINERLQRR